MQGLRFGSYFSIVLTTLALVFQASPTSAQSPIEGSWSLNQPGFVPEFKPAETPPRVERLASAADTNSAPVQESAPVATQGNTQAFTADPFISGIARGAESLGATKLSGSFIQTALLLGALGLAPAILLMTTCYIRIMVVFGLLRQALGTTQLPPTQVLMSLSIFLTILVMTPVWMEIKTKAFDPWNRTENPIGWEQAWAEGNVPLKEFMAKQIEISGNRSAVEVLYRHGKVGSEAIVPEKLSSAPLNVILPAFILSELKVAFLLGFQIFLPFLVLDLVVSTVTVSMGLSMLPPTMVSLPLKLILFVMVDGWNLVVGMLLQSFGGG
ncbi:MAG: flagellar type III secretion system pore protein FliP [Planctomycetota bacterium]